LSAGENDVGGRRRYRWDMGRREDFGRREWELGEKLHGERNQCLGNVKPRAS